MVIIRTGVALHCSSFVRLQVHAGVADSRASQRIPTLFTGPPRFTPTPPL